MHGVTSSKLVSRCLISLVKLTQSRKRIDKIDMLWFSKVFQVMGPSTLSSFCTFDCCGILFQGGLLCIPKPVVVDWNIILYAFLCASYFLNNNFTVTWNPGKIYICIDHATAAKTYGKRTLWRAIFCVGTHPSFNWHAAQIASTTVPKSSQPRTRRSRAVHVYSNVRTTTWGIQTKNARWICCSWWRTSIIAQVTEHYTPHFCFSVRTFFLWLIICFWALFVSEHHLFAYKWRNKLQPRSLLPFL
jgi:hypothetical protein